MVTHLQFYEYSSFDVDTLNEVSIQLGNLRRGVYPYHEKPVVRWLDGYILSSLYSRVDVCIVALIEH